MRVRSQHTQKPYILQCRYFKYDLERTINNEQGQTTPLGLPDWEWLFIVRVFAHKLAVPSLLICKRKKILFLKHCAVLCIPDNGQSPETSNTNGNIAPSQPFDTALAPVRCRLPNYLFMTSVSWMDQRSDLGMTAKRISNISAANQILNNLSLHLYLCNSDPSDKTTIIIMCSSNTTIICSSQWE